jgi:hypothetical protein
VKAAVVGGLLLCGGLALALYATSSSPKSAPRVTLSFAGFTNRPVSWSDIPRGTHYSMMRQDALLLAKNSDSVPVEVWLSVSNPNEPLSMPIEGPSPFLLKPGESTQLIAICGKPTWSVQIHYQRRSLLDRMCLRLWSSHVAPLEAISYRLSSGWWQLTAVKLGPMTNQPPEPDIGPLGKGLEF